MTPQEAYNILSQLAGAVALDERNGDIRKEAKAVLQAFLKKTESDAHITVTPNECYGDTYTDSDGTWSITESPNSYTTEGD